MTVLTREQKQKFYGFIRQQLVAHKEIKIKLLMESEGENWREKQRKELEQEFIDDQGQTFSAEEADMTPEELAALEKERIKYKNYRGSTGVAGSGFSEAVIDFQHDAYNALFYADIAKETYNLIAPKFVKDLGAKQGKRAAAAAVGFMAKNGVKNVFARGATSVAFRSFLGGTATVLGLGSGFFLPLTISIVGPIVVDKALEWLIVEKDVFGVRGGIGHSNPHAQKHKKMIEKLRKQNKRYYAPADKNYSADEWAVWPIPVQNRWCTTGDGEKPYIRRDKGILADGPDCSEVAQAYNQMANNPAEVQVEFENNKKCCGTEKAIEFMEAQFPQFSFNEDGLDTSKIAFDETTVDTQPFSVSRLDSMVRFLDGEEGAEVDIAPESEDLGAEAAAAGTVGAALGGAALKPLSRTKNIILKKIKGHKLERRQKREAKKIGLSMMQISKNLRSEMPNERSKKKKGVYTPELFYAIASFQKKHEAKLKNMGVRRPVTGIYDKNTHELWLSMNKDAKQGNKV